MHKILVLNDIPFECLLKQLVKQEVGSLGPAAHLHPNFSKCLPCLLAIFHCMPACFFTTQFTRRLLRVGYNLSYPIWTNGKTIIFKILDISFWCKWSQEWPTRPAARGPLFCSYHFFTSSVIYNWTDARQNGIFLLMKAWNDYEISSYLHC